MATNRKTVTVLRPSSVSYCSSTDFGVTTWLKMPLDNQQILSLLKAKQRTSLTVRCVQTTDSLSREWKKISTLLWKHGKPVEMARAGSHSRLKTKSL